MRIDGRRNDWRAWTFPDGEEWTVRHSHAPRRPLRRAIVAGAYPASPDDLNVWAYVPGGPELQLVIVDVLPPREVLREPPQGPRPLPELKRLAEKGE